MTNQTRAAASRFCSAVRGFARILAVQTDTNPVEVVHARRGSKQCPGWSWAVPTARWRLFDRRSQLEIDFLDCRTCRRASRTWNIESKNRTWHCWRCRLIWSTTGGGVDTFRLDESNAYPRGVVVEKKVGDGAAGLSAIKLAPKSSTPKRGPSVTWFTSFFRYSG